MEPLIAVAKIRTVGTGGVKFIWAWIKKLDEAKEKLLVKLEQGEEILSVWTSKWRDEPSTYKLQFGENTHVNQQPNFDMSADVRMKFLKPKGNSSNKKQHRIAKQIERKLNNIAAETKPAVEKPPEIPAYRPYSLHEAEAVNSGEDKE